MRNTGGQRLSQRVLSRLVIKSTLRMRRCRLEKSAVNGPFSLRCSGCIKCAPYRGVDASTHLTGKKEPRIAYSLQWRNWRVLVHSQEYAAWFLANIAGDNTNRRDMALDAGALQPLLASMHVGAPLNVKRLGAGALSKLLHGKPAVRQSAVRAAVPVLSHLISVDDTQTVISALWGLGFAFHGSNDRKQTVLESGVLPRVISKLRRDEDLDILHPALRIVAIMMTGDDDQTQAVLDAGAALAIRKLLSVPQKDEVAMVCLWVIRSVAVGKPSQLQHLIDLDFMPLVVDLITTQKLPTTVMKEAVSVLANVMQRGTKEHRTAFFNEGFVPAFVACLKHSGPCAETDQMALECLGLLMEHGTTLSGSGDNPCVSAAVDAGIVDALRSCASNGRDVMAFAKKWFPLA